MVVRQGESRKIHGMRVVWLLQTLTLSKVQQELKPRFAEVARNVFQSL